MPIARNEPLADWVRDRSHNNRCLRCSGNHRARRWRAGSQYSVKFHSGEILRDLLNATSVAIGVAPLDRKIDPFYVTPLTQASDQRLIEISAERLFCERNHTNVDRLFRFP